MKSEHIKNSLPLWEGEKLTLNHPAQVGLIGPAGQKKTREKLHIGYFFNVDMKDDKLVGQAWLNQKKASKHPDGKRVLKKAKNGEPVDVSTGYLADVIMPGDEKPVMKTINGPDRPVEDSEYVENVSGMYEGQQYEGVQVNIRPDHLAVLPNMKGKCSVDDGCGLNQNVDDENNITIFSNIISTGRVPNYDGKASADERQWPDGGPTLSDYIDGFLENADTELTEDSLDRSSWGNNPEEFINWAVQLSILGENKPVLPVVFPDTLDLSEDGLDSARRMAMQVDDISNRTGRAAQGIARNLLEEEFNRDFEEETENMSDQCDSFFQMMQNWLMRNSDVLPDPDGFDGDIDDAVEEVTGSKTENQIAPEDAGDFETAREALNEYINGFGADASNTLNNFMDWLRSNSEATGNEISQIEDAKDALFQAIPEDAMRNTTAEEFRGWLREQLNENSQTTNQDDTGGDFDLSELSEEQKDALSELDADTIRALNSVDADQISSLIDLAEQSEDEREGMIYALATNDDVPFGEDELRDMNMNRLSGIAEMVEKNADEPGGTDASDQSANFAGSNGIPGTFNPTTNSTSDSDPTSLNAENLGKED